jgi:hypothetical protein
MRSLMFGRVGMHSGDESVTRVGEARRLPSLCRVKNARHSQLATHLLPVQALARLSRARSRRRRRSRDEGRRGSAVAKSVFRSHATPTQVKDDWLPVRRSVALRQRTTDSAGPGRPDHCVSIS